MAKKTSPNKIPDFSADWGRDAMNGLPYSGEAVQDFIKTNLRSKFGCFYYDQTNSRNLVFADEASRDAYLADPVANDSLLLGRFDAQSNYEARIYDKSDVYMAFLKSDIGSGHYIDFKFQTLDKHGAVQAENVLVRYTFAHGASTQTITERYNFGEQVHFNIDNYIEEGTTYVTVNLTGTTTLEGASFSVTVKVVNLQVSTDFDMSTNYAKKGTVVFPLTINGGNDIKYIEWYLDGIRQPTTQSDTVTRAEQTLQRDFDYELNVGFHSIQACAYVEDESGKRFYSNTIYREFMVTNPLETSVSDYVVIGTEFPSGVIVDNVETPLSLYGLVKYEPYSILLAGYTRTAVGAVTAEVKLGDTSLGTLVLENGQQQTYEFMPFESGEQVFSLVYAYRRDIDVTVADSSLALNENNEGLMLNLRAFGRNNGELDKDVWADGERGYAEFNGILWTEASGWKNNALLVNNGASVTIHGVAPLGNAPTTRGRTIELEFSTQNVDDDSAVLCDLSMPIRNGSDWYGLKITASKAILRSFNGIETEMPYAPNTNVRIAIVLNSNSSAKRGLAFIYVDGVISSATNFSYQTDSFEIDKEMTFVGSADAEIAIKHIRIYNNALDNDGVLNNYILYRDSVAERLAIFDKNKVLDVDGSFDPNIIAKFLPVMILEGPIPELENQTDKGKWIQGNVYYTNLQDPTRSFTIRNAGIRPQGTSSMAYPKKNFRIYTQKNGADNKNVLLDADGNVVTDRLYSFKEGAQRVNCWCLKADFAESSGTHNTGVARMWNEVLKNASLQVAHTNTEMCEFLGIDTSGESQSTNFDFLTDAQRVARENDYPYDVRTTVDGFPIALFYRLTPTSPLVFCGKYNFNNDKSTESVYGFKGIPNFDNRNVECWEVLGNKSQHALFKTLDGFDAAINDTSFEARYPEGTAATYLKQFATWMVQFAGHENEQTYKTKFHNEAKSHFNLPMMAAYYCYLSRQGAVDQVVKNAMFTTFDRQHWFYINYDNDTVNSLDNSGRIAIPFDAMMTDVNPVTGNPYFEGTESVLWNMLRGDATFMQLVSDVDYALTKAGYNLAGMLHYFDELQSSKWCERIYNQDAQYKYIDSYLSDGDNTYLFDVQGARKSQRRYWLTKRQALIDSMLVSGDYRANFIEAKMQGMSTTDSGHRASIIAGTSMNYAYGVNGRPHMDTVVHVSKNEGHTWVFPQGYAVGDPINFFAAPNIKSLDLSDFSQYLYQLNVSGANDPMQGTKLERLILGTSETPVNNQLDRLALGALTYLKELSIVGYKNFRDIDLSTLHYLEIVNASNTALTSLSLPNGAPISSLTLPASLVALELRNLSALTDEGFVIEGIDNLALVSIDGCQNFNSREFVMDWIAAKGDDVTGVSLVLKKMNWSGITADEIDALAAFKDKVGAERCQLSGTINITVDKNDDNYSDTIHNIINTVIKSFGIDAFEATSSLYFRLPDGLYILGPTEVLSGESAQYQILSSIPDATIISQRFSMVSPITGVSLTEDGLFTTNKATTDRNTTLVASCTIMENGNVVNFEDRVDVLITKRTLATSWLLNGPSMVDVNDTTNEDGTKSVNLSLEVFPKEFNTDYNVTYEAVKVTPTTKSATNKWNGQYSDVDGTSVTDSNWSLERFGNITAGTPYRFTINGDLEDDIIVGFRQYSSVKWLEGYKIRESCTIIAPANVSFIDLSYRNTDPTITVQQLTISTESLPNATLYTPNPKQGVTLRMNKEFTYPKNIAVKATIVGDIDLNVPNMTAVWTAQCSSGVVILDRSKGANDAALLDIFFAKGFCNSNQTMTSGEAAEVTQAQFNNLGTVFQGTNNPDVTNLACLKYFTGVTSVPSSFAKSNTNLVSVVLSPSMETVSQGAFQNCTNLVYCDLTYVKTLNSDSSYNGAIKGCSKLSMLTADGSNILPNLTTLGSPTYGYHFSGDSALLKFIAPKLTNVSASCFRNCTALEEVELEACTYLYNPAFLDCPNLRVCHIPNVTGMAPASDTTGNGQFSGCTSLTVLNKNNTNNELPELTNVAFRAFFNCSSLTSIEAPKCTSIGRRAFSGTSLVSAKFPSCTSMDTYVFYQVTTLQNAEVGTVVGDYAFSGCTTLESVDLSICTSIGVNAFFNCSNLHSIGNTEYVTRIGASAFEKAGDGTLEVSFPSLTTLSGYKHFYQSGVKKILNLGSIEKIPSITSSSQYWAYRSLSLEEVHFPPTLKTIEKDAFNGCSSLRLIVGGESIETIETTAFYGTSLECDMSFPKLTSIGAGAFKLIKNKFSISRLGEGCVILSTSSYTNYAFGDSYITSINLQGVTEIQYHAFDNCPYLEEIGNTDAVVMLDTAAFVACPELKTVISMPNLETVASGVFRSSGITGVSDFGKVSVLNGNSSYYNATFRECKNLRYIILPDTLTAMNWQEFSDCTTLKCIVFKSVTPPTITSSTFSGMSSTTVLYVPSSSFYAYTDASGWSSYASRTRRFEEVDSFPSNPSTSYGYLTLSAFYYHNGTNWIAINLETGEEATV